MSDRDLNKPLHFFKLGHIRMIDLSMRRNKIGAKQVNECLREASKHEMNSSAFLKSNVEMEESLESMAMAKNFLAIKWHN